MIFQRKFALFIILLFTFSLIFSGSVFAGESITMKNSEFRGSYNLSNFEEKTGNDIVEFKQSPELDEKVKAGEISPLEERLPDDPIVLVPWENVGNYGGTVRWCEFTTDYDHYLRHINTADLLDRPPSSKHFHKSGLLGPTDPGIISEWNMGSEGKVFTFKIREGLKWSDGNPVTTEDVEFYIEEIAKNENIIPVPEEWLRWQEEETQLEVIDKYRFKIIFGEPFGAFIEDVFRRVSGGSNWQTLMVPKHYFKQFHKNYNSWDEILPVMKELGYEEKESWGTFYSSIVEGLTGGGLIGNPFAEEIPTLDPFKVEEVREDGTWIFVRNPYYYKIDSKGQQLPYIDKLRRQYISNKEMVNMEIIQGNIDVQTQFLKLADYPLYKEKENEGNYEVIPLRRWQHTAMMFFCNLSIDNEIFPREVMQDVRFRRALSLALDRKHIKNSVFLDFGRISQIGPRPESPYYEEGLDKAYVSYKPEKARELLDEIGIKDTDGDGWREWEGEQLRIPFNYYEVTPVATPGAELAKRYWEDIGLQVDIKQVDGNYYWERAGANKIPFSIWWGGGADLPSQHWLRFGNVNTPGFNQWFSSDGEEGVEPPEWVKEVRKNSDQLLATPSKEERIELGKKILRQQAEKIWLIGTVTDAPAPFVFNKKLENVKLAQEKDFIYTTPLEFIDQWYYGE